MYVVVYQRLTGAISEQSSYFSNIRESQECVHSHWSRKPHCRKIPKSTPVPTVSCCEQMTVRTG